MVDKYYEYFRNVCLVFVNEDSYVFYNTVDAISFANYILENKENASVSIIKSEVLSDDINYRSMYNRPDYIAWKSSGLFKATE